MSDEKVIVDKEDYIEMINTIETLQRISKDDFVIEGGLGALLKLLGKAVNIDNVILDIIEDMNQSGSLVFTILIDSKKNILLKKAQPYEVDN